MLEKLNYNNIESLYEKAHEINKFRLIYVFFINIILVFSIGYIINVLFPVEEPALPNTLVNSVKLVPLYIFLLIAAIKEELKIQAIFNQI